VTAPEQQDDAELRWWPEAQQIVAAWEEHRGRLLPLGEATELTRRLAMALQRAYERGKAQIRSNP
jgi:hypothetical protein